MKKNYQTTTSGADHGRVTSKKARPAARDEEATIALPDTVTVAIADLAGELEEGLLAFAVGTGLKVLEVLLESDATTIAGEKGRHDPDRVAVRHGSDDGLATLGGRQVQIRRPRLRSAGGSTEVHLPTYELASSTELLGASTLARMLAKLSCRRYVVGLEPMGEAVAKHTRSVSKSAVSRRFVAMTESALAELMSADLSELDLVVVMIDGANFGDHLCVVALGIAADGTKVPLALVEGDTENATVVKRLLVGLRERGLDVRRPTLFVIDGSKALPPAIKAVFDHPVIARCQEHKVRNVRNHLPKDLGPIVERRMRTAYRNADALVGQGDLEALARELDRSHPGAAASLPRGPGRDLHGGSPEGPADAVPHPAFHQRHRVHDRHLQGPRSQRQALARRSDGIALVCGRHGRSEEAVPPRERTSAPASAADCPRSDYHTRSLRC